MVNHIPQCCEAQWAVTLVTCRLSVTLKRTVSVSVLKRRGREGRELILSKNFARKEKERMTC